MFNKNFWIGVTVGLICVGLIGRDLYIRINSPIVINPDVIIVSPTPANDLSSSEPISSQIPTPSSKAVTPVKTTPNPSIKTVTVTPTPTPKPVIDYYVNTHNQINLLNNASSNTEFIENQTYPQIRFEAGFKVNNANAGDSVLYKVYEDGVLQESTNHNVFSTTNFTFADVYYAKSRNIGTHTVKMTYNEDRKYSESNYSNNEHTFTFKILPETTPPTFTIDGPTTINNQTCLRWINLQDNFSVYTDVWAKWKIDDGSWSNRTSENPYGCITGISGSSHVYSVHAEDFRGNTREESKSFIVY